PSFRLHSIFNPPALPSRADLQNVDPQSNNWQDRLIQLIRSYRSRGHIIAELHPIGSPPPGPQELDPSYFWFSEADMNRLFPCETLQCAGPLTLREILERLRNTYCRSIGVQYTHIDNLAE